MFESRVRPERISSPMTSMAAVGLGIARSLQEYGVRYRPVVMRFQTPLEPAVLIRRYKRFLADIRLQDGREVVAHCANPGAMTGLAEPGARIWVEPNDDPKKKLKYGWRLVDHGNGHFTGVDTSVPNRALREALVNREIDGLAAYETVLPEQSYGAGSRIDFLLEGAGRR